MAQLKSGSTVAGVAIAKITDIPVIDTLWVPAGAILPYGAIPASWGTKVNGSTPYLTYDYYAFDGASAEYVCFNVVMPENWNLGTVKAKFYWSSPTGSTAGDTVEWIIYGQAMSNDDPLIPSLGTSQVISDTLLADNGADLQISGATPAVTISGTPVLGDLVSFLVGRNVSGADNMTEDAWLFGVLLQFTKNTTAIAAW